MKTMYSVLGDDTVENSHENIADNSENAHLISTQNDEPPAHEILGSSSGIRTFDGSFWQRTPYKGPPTDKVISAWHGITHTPALNITAEEMHKMGKSLDSVQYPDDIGGGYLAYSEAAHQLHCLESLWEDHHYNLYPEYFPILTEKRAQLPEIMEHHYEHCVDVIRQQLMCTADPGLVTFRWVEGISGPYPDFNTKHVCHDYDALLEWGEGRKANDLVEGRRWSVPESGIVKLSHDWASKGSTDEVSFDD